MADSFDGIMVRAMTAVTSRSHTVRTRSDAIPCMVQQFTAFAQCIRIMEECTLEDLCIAKGSVEVPMLN